MGVGRCRPDVMHVEAAQRDVVGGTGDEDAGRHERVGEVVDRKSTRLNSSHSQISYAVFCLKKKKHRDSNSNDSHGPPSLFPGHPSHRSIPSLLTSSPYSLLGHLIPGYLTLAYPATHLRTTR